MKIYSISGKGAPWWVRLLTVMIGIVLLVGLFFFAVFAVVIAAILGGGGMLYLWWQRRKLRKDQTSDIIVTDYREIHRHRSPFDRDQ